jgi:hypothetical protein
VFGGVHVAHLFSFPAFGSKRVDLRFWKTDTIPTKVGVSLSLLQWKVLYSAMFTLSSSSVSQSLSFNLLQSLYCPLFLVLTLCLPSATQVVDDLISRAKDRESVDWRYHLGEDVYVSQFKNKQENLRIEMKI